MKKKYLVLRRADVYYEACDSFDDYYEGYASMGIPTEHVIELSDEEIKVLNHEYGGLIFIPILDKIEVDNLVANAHKRAKEEAKKRAAQKKKREAAAAKRKATMAAKREEKEKAKLKELQEKYGK